MVNNDLVWIRKYRPKNFDELVFDRKDELLKLMEKPLEMPSLIFHSTSAGTGKTSTALLIAEQMGVDFIKVNASDNRKIDDIRELKPFLATMSFDPKVKKCLFLDEADGIISQAQEAMKAMIDQYEKNCFFILSCNDVSKIDDKIRSRCIEFNFDNINKNGIFERIKFIAESEKVPVTDTEIKDLINFYYPDSRIVINKLFLTKVTGKKNFNTVTDFKEMIDAIKKQNINFIYQKVYGSDFFDLRAFVHYFFKCLYISDKLSLERRAKISILLADIEKSWSFKVNEQVVFLANITEIMRILSTNEK